MATIIANGCFDLLHPGHKRFLWQAKTLGSLTIHHLIVAVNSDRSAQYLKADKWGIRYPLHPEEKRAADLSQYADQVMIFDTEQQLHDIIEFAMPCIIVKGPDYVGKRVTGDDIAPVLILDTPETAEIRELKRKAYML